MSVADDFDLKKALKITSPVFFGYVAIGIPFGLMTVDAGYPWWLAALMSVFIYSGTGQYMAVSLLAAGAPLSMFLVTQLFIGIRHCVYGLSLLGRFKGTGRLKPLLIFLLTDETYALLSTVDLPEGGKAKGRFLAQIAVLDYLYWIAGSVAGALLGTFIKFSFNGVDFALNALFIVILINQIKAERDFFPPLCGIASCALAIYLAHRGVLPEQHILIVALTLGITVLLFARGIFSRKRYAQPPEKTQSTDSANDADNSQTDDAEPQFTNSTDDSRIDESSDSDATDNADSETDDSQDFQRSDSEDGDADSENPKEAR